MRRETSTGPMLREWCLSSLRNLLKRCAECWDPLTKRKIEMRQIGTTHTPAVTFVALSSRHHMNVRRTSRIFHVGRRKHEELKATRSSAPQQQRRCGNRASDGAASDTRDGDPKTGKETVLYTFTGGADGSASYGGVIPNKAGKLFGTTEQSGTSTYGTIFELDPRTGTETVLHDLAGPDGAFPFDGLTQDSAGNLYGTTNSGGSNGLGDGVQASPLIEVAACRKPRAPERMEQWEPWILSQCGCY
jgi:uncharacterized repeat protein (TIGR03803 family)